MSTEPPKKGSAEWRRNETIINNNPALKKMRDISQGVSSSGSIVTPPASKEYQEGWERIFGKNKNQD